MKKWTIILAAFGLVLCACNKEEKVDSSDIVGEWKNANSSFDMSVTLTQDGKYIENTMGIEVKGTWSLNKDSVLHIEPENDDPVDCDVKILGGKAAMVLGYGDDSSYERSLFYKKGAQVKSGALKDGRYDAPHNGIKGNDDRTVTFIVQGNNMEMYVHAWGQHYKGTYKIENGYLKYDITWGEHGEDTVNGGWFAGQAQIDFENFKFGNPDYKWLEGYGYKDVFSSFPLCVSDDGKDAYMAATGLTRWLYLR